MKKFTKTMCLVLSLLMLLPSAVACNDRSGEGDTSDKMSESVAESDNADSEQETFDLTGATMIFGEDVQFNIIISSVADSKTEELANELCKYLGELSGKRFKCISDTSVAASKSEGCEILVGKTNRTESKDAYKGLRDKDWSCKIVGSRIVIAANVSSSLYKAVDYFKSSVIKTADGLLYSNADKSYAANYYINNLSVGETPINDYVIVYPEGDYSASIIASEVARQIADFSGYVLDICDDREAASTNEILIGKTNRAESDTAYSSLANGGSAKISLLGKRLVVAYGNRIAMEQLASELKSGLNGLIGKSEADIGKLGLEYTDSYDANGKEEFSVMSFNIWNVFNASLRPLSNRDDMAASLILSYMPDVFGLQEYDALFRTDGEDFEQLVSEYYAEVKCSGIREQDNWNPIFYRKDKYELVECGHHVYSKGTEYSYPAVSGEMSKFRTLTWAVLKSKSSGKIITVLNTHFDTNTQNLKSESDELLEIVSDLSAKYGNNLFVTGDYNDKISGTACTNMLNYGFADTYAMAEEKNDTSGTHGEPKYSSTLGIFNEYDASFTSSSYQGGAIDHCLTLNKNITVRNYRIVTSEDALLISDHCPVWVRAYI